MSEPTLPSWPRPSLPPQRTTHVTFGAQLGSWWRAGTWQKIGLIAIPSAVVLLVCCSSLVVFSLTPVGQQLIRETNMTATAQAQFALIHHSQTQTAVAGFTATPTPAPIATTKPSPTALKPTTTPHGPVLTGATFGGMEPAFDAKYGRPPDGLYTDGGITFSLNFDTGTDGQPHVFDMLIYPSDASTWTLTQAEHICVGWNPPNTTFKANTTDGSGNTEQVFQSAGLAATFPGGGVFSIDYVPPHGGSSDTIFQCEVMTGVV